MLQLPLHLVFFDAFFGLKAFGLSKHVRYLDCAHACIYALLR